MPAPSRLETGWPRFATSTIATARAAPSDKQNRFDIRCLARIALLPGSDWRALGHQQRYPCPQRRQSIIQRPEPTQLPVFVPAELVQMNAPPAAMQNERWADQIIRPFRDHHDRRFVGTCLVQ